MPSYSSDSEMSFIRKKLRKRIKAMFRAAGGIV
jgi:hypothetical protein